MNFLLGNAQTPSPEQPGVHRHLETRSVAKTTTTLEGLIAEDPFPQVEDGDRYSDLIGGGGRSGFPGCSSVNNQVLTVDNHEDVTEDEGWITIPCKELPDNWSDALDINSFRTLDRSFVFPGEQVHILACISTSKKDREIITPFRVAALMNKNGNNKQQNGSIDSKLDSSAEGGKENDVHQSTISQIEDENGETQLIMEATDTQPSISASESILRMEDHKKQTETELARFKNSHFFVRIAESDELLWSKRSATEPRPSEMVREKLSRKEAGARKVSSTEGHLNTFVDRGNFDASVSGGVARDAVKCCSLSNGDIVVLLQVNVGVSFMSDSVLEVLQYEKYRADATIQNHGYFSSNGPVGAPRVSRDLMISVASDLRGPREEPPNYRFRFVGIVSNNLRNPNALFVKLLKISGFVSSVGLSAVECIKKAMLSDTGRKHTTASWKLNVFGTMSGTIMFTD